MGAFAAGVGDEDDDGRHKESQENEQDKAHPEIMLVGELRLRTQILSLGEEAHKGSGARGRLNLCSERKRPKGLCGE